VVEIEREREAAIVTKEPMRSPRSIRLMTFCGTPAAAARSCCDQSRRSRAAPIASPSFDTDSSPPGQE
jgi:hypothetical protein